MLACAAKTPVFFCFLNLFKKQKQHHCIGLMVSAFYFEKIFAPKNERTGCSIMKT